MNYDCIKVETDKRGVTTITLNRPDVHNALSAQLIAELQNACDDINASSEIRVCLLYTSDAADE